MKRKEQDLLNYLAESKTPIRSTELANALGVSVRSIKNYIQSINSIYARPIILSSRNGYQLSGQNKISLVISNNQDTNIPQTLEERSFYIIKQLVLSHSKHIDIFDLCDSLCVSYSTIKSIISKMNKMYTSYEVEFLCKNDCLVIMGNEYHKRKLLSYVMNEECKNSLMNIDTLKNNFTSLDVNLLSRITADTFKKYNYYLNDFSAMNLLLHLLIIIDRESNGNELNNGKCDFVIDNLNEKRFFEEFINLIEKNFNITINKYEKFEIYVLFKTNANFSIENSSTKLEELVGKEIIDLVDSYIEKINNLYMIDLESNTFKTPFALHLKILLYRAKEDRKAINPLTETIKNNSPLIFDVAIYVALDLMDRFNMQIDEDETAFLAMHIGAEVERQAVNREKIPVAVYSPNYLNIAERIMNSLMLNFGNQINVLGCTSKEEDLEKFKTPISILFTTVPLKQNHNFIVVNISPLNISSQFSNIQNAILKSQEDYHNYKLKVNFDNFFEENLFITNTNLKTKQQILTSLCDGLNVKNYVDSAFEESIYKRESMATTAFGNIAIPHSIDMNAYKTSIAVAISKEGFIWDSNTVHIVFLLAINKADRKLFRPLYESLIYLFSNERVISEIRNCSSFSEFKNIIYSEIGQNMLEEQMSINN